MDSKDGKGLWKNFSQGTALERTNAVEGILERFNEWTKDELINVLRIISGKSKNLQALQRGNKRWEKIEKGKRLWGGEGIKDSCPSPPFFPPPLISTKRFSFSGKASMK